MRIKPLDPKDYHESWGDTLNKINEIINVLNRPTTSSNTGVLDPLRDELGVPHVHDEEAVVGAVELIQQYEQVNTSLNHTISSLQSKISKQARDIKNKQGVIKMLKDRLANPPEHSKLAQEILDIISTHSKQEQS